MLKSLLKKQIMEVFSSFYMDRKTGKPRTGAKAIGFLLLYVFLFGYLGVMFFFVAKMLGESLFSVGFGWMYFAIISLIGVSLAVFGSVFNTYSSLYLAKDNDFLLSMPIKPKNILFMRLSGVYAVGLFYGLVVMIPSIIVYFIYAPFNIFGAVFTLLLPFILSLFSLTLSCILGWVVALVSKNIKRKNIVTTVLSLAFFGAYFFLYNKAYSALQLVMASPDVYAPKLKKSLYILYQIGLATEGKLLSMLIFTLTVVILFALIYILLSKSFLGLATAKKGSVKAVYKERPMKKKSPASALFKKELLRFTSSPTYMLNCGLGIIMTVIIAVLVLVKGGDILAVLGDLSPRISEYLSLVAVAMVALTSSMTNITSPSVSLEGKSIWLLQSLPLSGWQALKAKLLLHIILALPSTLMLAIAFEIVIKPSAVYCILILIISLLYLIFSAAFGLFLNLKLPNLNWTSETVPVKQGAAVPLSIFGSWAIVLLFGLAYFFTSELLSPIAFLIIVAVLFSAAVIELLMWLKNRGSHIFEKLS